MSADTTYRTPAWSALWLGIGFFVLVGIGLVTVLGPELEDEPGAQFPPSEQD